MLRATQSWTQQHFPAKEHSRDICNFLDRKGEDGLETIPQKIQIHFQEKTNDSSHF